MNTEIVQLSQIRVNDANPRTITDAKFHKLVNSILSFPKMLNIRPIAVDAFGVALGGNMRYRALSFIADMSIEQIEERLKEIDSYKKKTEGEKQVLIDYWIEWLQTKEVEIVKAENLSEEEKREFIIKDNVGFGEWNWDELANEWDVEQLESWGLDLPIFESQNEEHESLTNPKKLADRFIIPPFSVLDTKQGDWQQRKNYWLSLGIKSEEGRDGGMIFAKSAQSPAIYELRNKLRAKNGIDPTWDEIEQYCKEHNIPFSSGTSVFDPVLTELCYRWFNIDGGKILYPFAGGSVRGIVASKLGFEYLGNDLRQEQIEANRNNAKEVLKDNELYPIWTCGDSLQIDKIAKDYKADMVFSCPPYADLEVYSDKKEDISNMPYNEFILIYNEIIRKSCELLKDDRFAVFVVGDVRDKKGFYQNFVSDTINAFLQSGLKLYNEMILLNSLGSAAIRVNGTFKSRKVVKVHQNVLVFYKGNPKNIKANYPELDLSYINEEIEIE